MVDFSEQHRVDFPFLLCPHVMAFSGCYDLQQPPGKSDPRTSASPHPTHCAQLPVSCHSTHTRLQLRELECFIHVRNRRIQLGASITCNAVYAVYDCHPLPPSLPPSLPTSPRPLSTINKGVSNYHSVRVLLCTNSTSYHLPLSSLPPPLQLSQLQLHHRLHPFLPRRHACSHHSVRPSLITSSFTSILMYATFLCFHHHS